MSTFRGEFHWFLQDHKLLQTPFWRAIKREITAQYLSPTQIVRLECDDQPRLLFEEPSLDLALKIYAPTIAENLLAQEDQEANATSGVLVLNVGQRKIVFPGDATIRQWRRIRAFRGRPTDCEILAVPHHAGSIEEEAYDLEWLYREGIRPRFAVVSVGTSNTYGHPRPEVIHALTAAGARILCTQITGRCGDDLESFRAWGFKRLWPGRSRFDGDLTTAGNSRNVACAGTVVAEVEPDRVVIHRFKEHQTLVDRFASSVGGHPLCRARG